MRLIVLTLKHTRARVKINKDYPSSATLFSLVIDNILKEMELRGNITTHLKHCTAYADEILLTTRTKQSLIDTFQKLKEISAQYVLTINGQKQNI
jgi:hypothetical protein